MANDSVDKKNKAPEGTKAPAGDGGVSGGATVGSAQPTGYANNTYQKASTGGTSGTADTGRVQGTGGSGISNLDQFSMEMPYYEPQASVGCWGAAARGWTRAVHRAGRAIRMPIF